jgi:hypothetical protein
MHEKAFGAQGAQIAEADTEAEDFVKALKVVADAGTLLSEEQGLGSDPAKPPLHSPSPGNSNYEYDTYIL